MKRFLPLVALPLLLLAATAQAQQDLPVGGTFTVATQVSQEPLAANGTTEVPYTVTVGCGVLLQDAGRTEILVTLGGAGADNFTAATEPLAVSTQACLAAGATFQLEVPGVLRLTPNEGAPGMVPIPLNLTAEFGARRSAPDEFVALVAYRPCYEVSVPDGHTFQVTTSPFTFPVTQTNCGNARSMVMYDPAPALQGGGELRGLQSLHLEPGQAIVQNVTFTPPTGTWTQVNATVTTYTHFTPLSGSAGDPVEQRTLAWTFRNAGVPATGGNGGGKDSPGAPALALLAAVGAAALLLRRRL